MLRLSFRVVGKRCLLLLLVLSAANSAFAQFETATVSGQVLDPSGLRITGALIKLVDIDRDTTTGTRTNPSGLYTFPSVRPGRYRMEVTVAGFKVVNITGLTVNVQDHLEQNFKLSVGSVSESVTVEGGAPMVDTESAAVSTVVDRQFAENLPLNGRSFQTLIQLTPGVVLTPGGTAGQFSVNGQRGVSNYWMVDGVSANIGIAPYATAGSGLGLSGSLGSFDVFGGTSSLVSVDALQEFRIQTSTYAPEFGRTPGGQISIVTRSGTNQFHGTAFDYFRNDILDANDWFADAASQPKPKERQNDFGGAFSGPILKDKTFFFFSYEGLRLRLPQVGKTTVPTLTARQNAIPAVQPYLNAFPLPNGPSSGVDQAQFNSSFSNPATLNAYSIRIDHKLSERFTLFGRFNYAPASYLVRGLGAALSDVGPIDSTTKTTTIGATWLVSPTITNDFRFNYSTVWGKTSEYLDAFGGAVPPTLATLQASNFLPSPYTLNTGQIAFASFDLANGNLVAGAAQVNSQQQFNWVDGVSAQRGSHSLKFGIDFRRLSPGFGPQLYEQGEFFLDTPSAEAGNALVSAVSSSIGARLLFHNLSLYAQDTWRVKPRLSLTYGVRWDVDFAPSTANGPSLLAVTGFNLQDLSQLGIAPAGTPPFKTTYGNVAPRFGLAYETSQSQDWGMVVRGGFGVFYDLATSEVGNTINTFQYPFGANTQSFGATFPLSATAAAPPPITAANLALSGELFASDPNLNEPYTLQWNVALEQGLGRDQTATVSYIGSAGRRLLARETITAPNANFGFADLASNAGTSDYNALQIQFQRRLADGLQALASYTWSHSIDTGSFGGYENGAFDSLSGNRGPSDFDIRNAFSAGVTYDVPAPKTNDFGNAVLRGWSLQNVIQARSAPPVDITDPSFSQLFGAKSSVMIRPDIVSGIPLYLSGPQYPGGKALNGTPNQSGPGCFGPFCPPPTDSTTGLPLRQGNLGRNALRGFGATQWDLAVHRDFPIHESLKLQFRAEMFNVLNHPNFGPPSSTLGSALFGQATQMFGKSLTGNGGPGGGGFDPLYQIGGPRSIQLALKLIF
jgi:Carboxypeptidase regulatory-like domain/TonB dependent receptor